MTELQLKKFNKRTGNLYSNHTARLRGAVNNRKLTLPWSLGYLRISAEKALSERRCCPYCKSPLTLGTLGLDHKIPVSRALEMNNVLAVLVAQNLPEDEKVCKAWAFAFGNYDFVCKLCNKRKGDLTHFEFKQLLSLVTTMHSSATSYILRKLGARLPFFKRAKAEGAAA
jgi:5-methylcytosine-specific restriction endonuclease McrA